MKNIIFRIVVSILSIIFFGIGLGFKFIPDLKHDKVNTKGVITKINKSSINVTYTTIDGKEVNTKMNMLSSNFHEGKIIDIYYHSKNPSKIGSIEVINTIFYIFTFIGITFILIVISNLMLERR